MRLVRAGRAPAPRPRRLIRMRLVRAGRDLRLVRAV